MSKTAERVALAFCHVVVNDPTFTNAAARFGVWLIGAADSTGGFPIELSMHQIRAGFEKNGVTVEGTGARHETIRNSIDLIRGCGLFDVSDGKQVGGGHTSNIFTLRG